MKYEKIEHPDGRIEFVPEKECFEGVLKNGEQFTVKLSGMILVSCSGSGSLDVAYYSDRYLDFKVKTDSFNLGVALTPRCFQFYVSKMAFDHADLKLQASGGDLAYRIETKAY